MAVRTKINRTKDNLTPFKNRFPLDLGGTYMAFNFKSYSYGGTSSKTQTRNTGSILLPLPQNLQDTFDINIGQAELGAAGAGIVDVFGTAESGNLGSVVQGVGEGAAQKVEGVDSITGAIADAATAAKYFSRSSLDSIAPSAGLAADVISGTAVNPHATLNFDGVNLKEYSFSWQLAPKNTKESDSLRDIIRKFKYNILPAYKGIVDDTGTSLDRALLTYPNLVEIELYGISEDHYFKFQKPGMIKNFSVDYSPQGNVILQKGKPGIVNLSFSFQEARIHTRGDYE